MAIKTYQISPYNDDFGVRDQNVNNKTAEEKNFLRILFKPGVSVQARELNQIQSILQNQIDKIGTGVFKEGPVPKLATEATLDRTVHYVDIAIPANTAVTLAPNLNQLEGLRLDYDPDSSPERFVDAEILHYEALSTTNHYRFYIKYLSSVQDDTTGENIQKFQAENSPADSIRTTNIVENPANPGENFFDASQIIGTAIETGKAIHAQSSEGVYFTKGEFVYSEEQNIYAKIPAEDYPFNFKVVYKVVEKIVTYQTDKSLLDNAAGYPNETAPGADRYTIDLQLSILSKDETDNDNDFIGGNTNIYGNSTSIGDTLFLLEFTNGSLVQSARPEFSGIIDVLAERSREETGDFTVEPYLIDITGFYNNDDDDSKCGRGVYTPTQMGDLAIQIGSGDISSVSAGTLASKEDPDRIKYGESRFVVGIEPSISYVDGYRIAEPERIEVIGEKARTFSNTTDAFSTANLGSYFIGTSISGGTPSFDVDTIYNITDGNGNATTDILATCRVRALEKTTSSFKLYVYDIELASNVTSLSGAVDIQIGPAGANGFKFTIDTNVDIGIYEPKFNRSIYKLPANFIRNVDATTMQFTARKVFTGQSVTTTNSNEKRVTLTVPNGDDKFEIEGANSYIIMDGSFQRAVEDVAIGGTNNSQVTLRADAINGATVDVIASYRSKLNLRTKTKETETNKELVAIEGNVATGDEFDLDHYDIIEIVSATDFAGNDVPLSDLVLDNGQRDGCYKKGKVTYTGAGYEATDNAVSPAIDDGGLKITYTYFDHSDDTGYFSVASYPDHLSIGYSDISTYKDMRLSDCLDFRAKVGDSESGTHLDPNSTIDSQLSYYLARIDKLVVTKDSEFKLIQGVPAIVPEEPSVPSTALHLYTLHIPAYTFCHTMIETSFIDNRRYTMKDIGSLNSRVNNLEYYTSLSLLEREANGKQIFETTNTNPYERFKNGIIVDSFQGHEVGNVFDPHYNNSMDPDDPILRPYFETRSVPLTFTGNNLDNTNITTNDGIATLSYTAGPSWIDQQKAAVSISVNPYDVATWLGSVKLSPSSDEWMETRRAPNIINEVGGNLSDLRAEVDRINQMGTRWNSWQTTWTGRPVTRTTMERRNRAGIPWGRGPGRGWVRRVTTTETQSRQQRTGIRTTASINAVTRVKDDRVIDVSFVPFMRARKIYFSGKLFKPNTKLKVFFDGKDITKYSTGIPITSQGVVPSGYKQWSSNPSVQVYHNRSNTQITGTGGDIISDNRGDVYGWFVVPNNKELQFPCGERKVILSDGKTATDPAASTSADATYTAQGKVQTKQRTLVTTRTVVRQSQRVTHSRIQNSSGVTRTQWYDPLAQSFIIGENPGGLFIHSVDLYFSHASTKNIPLKLYLVEMENGMPTQRRVPGSDVIKQPGDVNTSNDASEVTTFTFDSPIYLQYGLEYAMVTESNSSEYRQWLSEVGKNDVNTGEYISKNPFLGVSFKSQNASTWTPDQMKDFKMRVREATFQSSGEIVLEARGISTTKANGDDYNPVITTDEIDGTLEYSQVQLNTDFIEHPETSIKFEISVNGGDYEVIVPNENHYISTAVDAPLTHNDNLKVRISLDTDNRKISPIIDLDRISLIAVKNVIGPEDASATSPTPADSLIQDSGDSELAADHGNATAVYMTKEVALNNPADRLDAYLNINKPYADSNVLVYARFKRSEDNIEDLTFERIDPETPLLINDIDDYAEVRYIRDFGQDSPTPPLFTSFQVKIVLVSNDHAIVPTVKDFRAIATV